jgi:serine/threonine-protein kinase/endoribonuclease IRE1
MSPCGGAADDVTYPIVPSSPGRRSILQIRREPPTEPNTKLVVDRDGKVFLKQQPKETPYWSFSTGSPMHSLYQAPANNNTENATEITRPHIIVEYLNNSKAATTVDGYHNWV